MDKEAEAGCIMSKVGLKCLLSALALCCPHGVLATVRVFKRSRRDT